MGVMVHRPINLPIETNNQCPYKQNLVLDHPEEGVLDGFLVESCRIEQFLRQGDVVDPGGPPQYGFRLGRSAPNEQPSRGLG